MGLWKRLAAEFLGTFWLVLAGCGAAVLAGPQVGGTGVSLAFGLSVLTMAYAIGGVSGCHLNPAVSIGLVMAGRFHHRELWSYVAAQVLGALAAAGLLAVLVHDRAAPLAIAGSEAFAANGYGERSPGGYGVVAAFATEAVMTFVFLWVILGATGRRAPPGFAPLAIGLCLTAIHLVSIPVTNTSVNPARSTGPAAVVGDWALRQLWLFWAAPILGAALAGFTWARLFGGGDADE
jgi:aquaporin Z